MKRILLFVLFLLPLPGLAKEFITPSGAIVVVPDAQVAYIEKYKPFTLPSGLIFWAKTLVEIPHAQADELTLTEKIKMFIYMMADKYDVDGDELIALARCESNFSPTAFNPKDPQGGAYGLFQYLRPTFLRWEKAMRVDFEYKNYEHQTEMTAWAFNKGYQMAWKNCYTFLKTGAWPKK